MGKSKYNKKDFEKVIKGEMTLKECADKYGVNVASIRRPFNRAGFYLVKRPIKIYTPYGNKIVESETACAEELGLSQMTISNILNKGRKNKVLEELEITIERL